MDYSISKGKCSDCEENKPLDEMVMVHKGNYHCIDCETDVLRDNYDCDWLHTISKDVKNDSKIKRLMGWCFGGG